MFLLPLRWSVIIGLLLGLSTGGAYAQKAKTPLPDEIPGATKVDAEGVINLVEKVRSLVIVDSRISGDRKHGYIENSVSLPDENTDCDTLETVIPNKTTPSLFYCNGVKCGRSVVAIKIALKCGYRKLYWFRGGYEEWQAKKYPTVRN